MATEKDHVGDRADDVESVEEEETGQDGQNRVMNFPNVLAALRSAELLANLPPAVKRRIKALKKLQLDANNVEANFFKEVHALECKYHLLYTPLYEKRNTIVSGAYEPTDEESQWASDNEEEISNELKEKVKIEDVTEPVDENVKGVPNFWLTIFRNVSILSEMVQQHDEPILKHLIDVKVVLVEEPMGFKLEFHFSPNEYFTNTVLTKEYQMKCTPDDDDPLHFEGPEIYKCVGCTINWNKGKNVTLKTLKKKQKHKSRGMVRTVTKTVQNDSFFNFFNPPTVPEDTKDEDVDDDVRHLLTADFELGHYFRERIITRAILYFTGDIVEDEEDFEEEEEDEEEEDDDDVGCKELSKSNNKDQNCKQQ